MHMLQSVSLEHMSCVIQTIRRVRQRYSACVAAAGNLNATPKQLKAADLAHQESLRRASLSDRIEIVFSSLSQAPDTDRTWQSFAT